MSWWITVLRDLKLCMKLMKYIARDEKLAVKLYFWCSRIICVDKWEHKNLGVYIREFVQGTRKGKWMWLLQFWRVKCAVQKDRNDCAWETENPRFCFHYIYFPTLVLLILFYKIFIIICSDIFILKLKTNTLKNIKEDVKWWMWDNH